MFFNFGQKRREQFLEYDWKVEEEQGLAALNLE